MIKTEVSPAETKPEFPKLMIDHRDGVIILAIGIAGNHIKGTVLHLGSYNEQYLSLGTADGAFSTQHFKSFVGSITLTQD